AASYALRIRVPNLDVLPAVVELVTTRKNAELTGLEWMYDGLDALLDTWLEGLLESANAKAERIARRLGVGLQGIHSFREERWDPDRPPPVTVQHDVNVHYAGAGRMAMSRQRARDSAGGALGFEMMHTKRVRLVVRVDYRVSPRS